MVIYLIFLITALLLWQPYFSKKNLEHALLNRLHEYLITSDNQFQTSPLYIDAYPDTQGALKILSRPWKYYVRVLFKCQ